MVQKYEWDFNNVHLICTNHNCQQKLEENQKAWLLNMAPVEGLKWLTISNINKSASIADLMQLNPYEDAKSGEKYLINTMIDQLQHTTFSISQFLLALNIQGLGNITAKLWEASECGLELCNQIYDNEPNLETKLSNTIKNKPVSHLILTEYKDYFCSCYNLIKKPTYS